MLIDRILLITFSDLLINLSAGWIGAAFIVPIAVKSRKKRFWALFINIVFGIVALGFAVA